LYKPSWTDRFIDWFDQLGTHAFLKYAFLFGIALVFNLSILWIDSSEKLWSFSFSAFLNAVWIVPSVGILHGLDLAAKKASEKIRPISELSCRLKL
jgi:hypothetical protein